MLGLLWTVGPTASSLKPFSKDHDPYPALCGRGLWAPETVDAPGDMIGGGGCLADPILGKRAATVHLDGDGARLRPPCDSGGAQSLRQRRRPHLGARHRSMINSERWLLLPVIAHGAAASGARARSRALRFGIGELHVPPHPAKHVLLMPQWLRTRASPHGTRAEIEQRGVEMQREAVGRGRD